MAKRKRTKGQTTVFKTLHRKHRATRSSLKTRNYLWCNGRVTSSCSTSGIRPVTLVTNPVYSNLVVHLKLFLMQTHTHTHFYWRIQMTRTVILFLNTLYMSLYYFYISDAYLVIVLFLDIISCPLTLFIIKCHHRSDEKPIPKWVRGLTSCFKVMLCKGQKTCCKTRKVRVDTVADAKHHFDDTDAEFNWTDVSKIWDMFFLRFYLVVVTFVTVCVIAALLYGFYS